MREKLMKSEYLVKHYNLVKQYHGIEAAENWLSMLIRTVENSK